MAFIYKTLSSHKEPGDKEINLVFEVYSESWIMKADFEIWRSDQDVEEREEGKKASADGKSKLKCNLSTWTCVETHISLNPIMKSNYISCKTFF